MYVELHCHSAFSFLDGASHPAELVQSAAQLGHGALALTDHDGLYGSMEFAHEAKAAGIKPITGAEISLDDGYHLTLLCENRRGYSNLCRLLTLSHNKDTSLDRQTTTCGAGGVGLSELANYSQGLICLSGCASRGAVGGRVEAEKHTEAVGIARRLFGIFGKECFRIELQRPFCRRDRRRNRLLFELALSVGVPCVATGNAHTHSRERAFLQDALVAVRLGATLAQTQTQRRANSSHALASPQAMSKRFADYPQAVAETAQICERLDFDLTRDLGYRYPGADDTTQDRKLTELCRSQLDVRYEGRSSYAQAQRRLERELSVISSLGLSGFFLLHYDMLELARAVALEVRRPDTVRELLPPGRGRGSSVCSIVCYLIGLSHIDPIENDLHLERFLNTGLTELPDIDLDFPRDIREALIPRIHERYGSQHSGLVGAFATYRRRSAVRDLAKVLDLPAAEIERVSETIDYWTDDPLKEITTRALGRQRGLSKRWQWLSWLVDQAQGLPRHVTQHVGGMVISTQPLSDMCPIQPSSMQGRQMVQWDKDSCADAGFLKIDLLGLGMLSAVERCVEQIEHSRKQRIDLSRIPLDDNTVYAAICEADTMGVFQIESRAQMQMLRRTRPESLADLCVQVALVRPGPIIGGAVHPYIERRSALRNDPSYEITYEHPCLEPVLKDTLGVIVFQDQVIEVAVALAGFSVGEAEGLRRAMSRSRSEAGLRAYRDRFIEGATRRGVSLQVADRVFDQITAFSGFGFPKAHSAAFALLAYQSTWLRVHYGPEFLCSLLNEQPMGFYPPDTLVHEAQRRGIRVLGPDVLKSQVECTIEWPDDLPATDGCDTQPAVRIGLGYVKGASTVCVRRLVCQRSDGLAFASVPELVAHCGSDRDQKTLERLAWAGALDSLASGGRREALWLLGVSVPAKDLDQGVGAQLALRLEPTAMPELDALGRWEQMAADYSSTELSTNAHPLALLRPCLKEDIALSAGLSAVSSGSYVSVAGLVVARQRPATAKGTLFMLLEDESATINLIVRPRVFERCRLAIATEPLVLARGRVQRLGGSISVVARDVSRLQVADGSDWCFHINR
jgi:error-prone DNA polymerase